jgi:hypothetical protein
MASQPQSMVERVDELERMVVRLNGRIGDLQRELKQTKGMAFNGWSGGFRLRALWGGIKPVTSTGRPIRENRRLQRHDLCLF